MQGVYISNAENISGAENICGTLSQNVGIGGYSLLRAFLIRGGKASLLPGLVARANTNATGVNAAGEVAGWADTGMQGLGHHPDQHACVWQGGVLRDLGLLAARKESTANGINSAGQVVGDVGPPEHRHAVIWGSSGLTVLGKTGDSSAAAINDKGQVVGNVGHHAELWEAGRSVGLESLRGYPLNAAKGINAAGLIVGEADDAEGLNGHAVIWIGGKVHDLNRLAPGCLGPWSGGGCQRKRADCWSRHPCRGRARVSSDAGDAGVDRM